MRYLKLFCLLFLATLLVQPVFAAQQNPDVTRPDLNNFDRFLDSHQAIEKDLRSNPGLVKDSAYLSAHPELKEFLANHPGVREEIRENPRGFMNRERHFEQSGRDVSKEEVRNVDNFLDKHPAIDSELSKHPALVNDPNYLAKHPELKEFLNAHPAVRQDLAQHPRAFMHREKAFDKAERKADRLEDRREDRREDQVERLQERREEQHERRFAEHPGRSH
jgi:phage-related protein